MVDAGGLYGPADNQQVIRLVVHADSAVNLPVSVMTPLFLYDEQRNNIAIATNSFKLLKPGGSQQLEEWPIAEAGEPAFHVAYPASWVSRPVDKLVPRKERGDILLARENELAGYLRVKATDLAVVGDMSTTRRSSSPRKNCKREELRSLPLGARMRVPEFIGSSRFPRT